MFINKTAFLFFAAQLIVSEAQTRCFMNLNQAVPENQTTIHHSDLSP